MAFVLLIGGCVKWDKSGRRGRTDELFDDLEN